MKIFIAGTFDLFHIGHQWLLWQAAKLDGTIHIIVARDTTVKNIKSKQPVWNESKRLQRLIDEKIPNTIIKLGRTDQDFMKTITDINPDILVCGYDQFIPPTIKSFAATNGIKIIRISAYFPELFKSSKFSQKNTIKTF